MKPIQKAILSYLDMEGVSSLVDYFLLLKKTFTTTDLVEQILEVSYSTFYQFHQQAKKGILVDGILSKKLMRLYTYSKTKIWSDEE